MSFHFDHLLDRVGIVSDVDEVEKIGELDLLELATDEQGSDSEELEVVPGDLFFLDDAVDESHCHVEGLGHQAELQVYFHQPVHQDRPHLFRKVPLAQPQRLTVRHQKA